MFFVVHSLHLLFLSAAFKKDLEKDVAGDTSGDFAKLLLALVQVTEADRIYKSTTGTFYF